MLVIILISLIAVFLAYRDRSNDNNKGLTYAFVLFTVIGAIRYEYGNDYNSYFVIFNDINRGEDFRDFGWVLLCKLFNPLGYQWLIAFTSIVQNVILYYIIKKYVPSKWHWLAVCIYAFNSSLWVLSMSMIRQTLSEVLIFASIPLIFNKKIPEVFFCVLAACSFHNTAFIMLPFLLLALVDVEQKKKMFLVILSVLFLLSHFSSQFVSSSFAAMMDLPFFEDDYYMGYVMNRDSENLRFGFGYLVMMLPFAMASYVLYKKENDEIWSLLLVIFIFCSVIRPFTSIMGLIYRLAYYFLIMSVIIIPYIVERVDNKIIRNSFLIIYLSFMAYEYIGFFNDEIYHDYYLEYHHIFESI